MGSLMAGWASPALDPERVRLERNKSLTKEEIEAFRKMHKRSDEGDGALPPSTASSLKENEEDAILLKKTAFWNQLESSSASELHKVNSPTGDWWTRSNWAFLNEPPHDDMDKSAHKYSAQFHVAQIATKKD